VWWLPFGALLCVPLPARAQETRWSVSVATADVRLEGTATAHVRQRFVLSAPLDSVAFEHLRFRCSGIADLAVRIGSERIRLTSTEAPPWRRWRATPASPVAAGSVIGTDYSVALQPGADAIPLLVPSGVLVRESTGASDELVVLSLIGEDVGAVPVLPRFTRQAGGRWTARLPAMPSLIRVDRASPAPDSPCPDGLVAGSSRRLELVFLLFVATLVLWVPLYFVWVWYTRRRTP
jgi:hypothetical protein